MAPVIRRARPTGPRTGPADALLRAAAVVDDSGFERHGGHETFEPTAVAQILPQGGDPQQELAERQESRPGWATIRIGWREEGDN